MLLLLVRHFREALYARTYFGGMELCGLWRLRPFMESNHQCLLQQRSQERRSEELPAKTSQRKDNYVKIVSGAPLSRVK